MKICKVDWCTEEKGKLGYCNRHYLQMRRHNKILPIKRNFRDPQEFEFYGDDCHIIMHDKNGNRIAVAIVDKSDYDLVKEYNFNFAGREYPRISGKTKEGWVSLHQLILGRIWGDHIDGDRLNNRRSNLRPCTNQQNQFNQKPQKGRLSKYKGVSMFKNRKKSFRAGIQFNSEGIHLGSFYTENEAAEAYNVAALKYFGEFAKLNIIE